jgi:general secretion pathway protein G
MYRTRRKSGFTLVEILIVVIILGILAAIVIPQFTNASQDARRNSLTSQLQTIRSQLSLASLQHRDTASGSLTTNATDPWGQLTVKTNDDYTTTGTPQFGSYLNGPPVNSLNGGTLVLINAGTTDPAWGSAVSGGDPDHGWVYYPATGKIYATTKSGTLIYDESGAVDNSSL